MNTLLKSNLPPELIETAAHHLGHYSFDTQCNRSVQGTMNQITQNIEYGLYATNCAVTDVSPYRYSAELSYRPCTVKGVKDSIWPEQAMKSLLTKLAQHKTY